MIYRVAGVSLFVRSMVLCCARSEVTHVNDDVDRDDDVVFLLRLTPH